MKKMIPEYEIKFSSRKTLSLEITREAQVLVRAPYKTGKAYIEAFVIKNSEWIEEHTEKRKVKNQREAMSYENQERIIALAKEVLPQKVEYFSRIMGVTPTSVRITDAKTRFGSCSGKNALCFSWRIMLYPEEAIDYVVIHELSHIVYHDHSKNFWQTVEKYMPNYKEIKKLLKN